MVTSQPFEYIIFTLIITNTITLGMKFYGQPELYTQALDILNMVKKKNQFLNVINVEAGVVLIVVWFVIAQIFTTVFALEFVLKLAAFRFKASCSRQSFWLASLNWLVSSLVV